MFIDEARQILQARGESMRPLLEAWQTVRLRFLARRAGRAEMLEARRALREALGDPGLFEQAQEAVLSELDDAGLDFSLQALFHELSLAAGAADSRARRDEILTDLELLWLDGGPQGGRARAAHDLERILATSRLPEERAGAWESLVGAGRAGAALAHESLRLEERIARECGHAGLLDGLGQRLLQDPGEARGWLDQLKPALAPHIRREAEQELAALADRLRRPVSTLTCASLGSLYLSDVEGRHGLPAAPESASLAARDPLDLLRETAELLGLECEGSLARWITHAHDLPEPLMGLIEGPDGRWPAALLDLHPGWRGARGGLDVLGRSLGLQAQAVGRGPEEQSGAPFPLRHLQARAFGLLLAGLLESGPWAARLLETPDPEAWEAWWRRRRLLRLGEDLLRLEWLDQAAGKSLAEAGELWLELRRDWLALPPHGQDRELWAADPLLSMRPGEVPLRVGAELLAAGLRKDWGAGATAEPAPELGGLLLDELTEPADPELWGEAIDALRAGLDPRALLDELRSRD